MAQRSRSLIVVRRGETAVFERLRDELGASPDAAELVWDRRVRDRRVIIQDVEVERRRGERRAPLDATQWASRGYIVARPQPPAGDATRARSRARSRTAGFDR